MSQRTIVTFTILTVLSSCQIKKEESVRIDSGLILTDSLVLELDSRSTPEFNFHQVYDFGDKEFLANLNFVNNSLDFFDLESAILEYRIDFVKDGPEKIVNTGGFYFVNEDSIFIFPKMSFSNTTLIDISGKILNRFSPNPSFESIAPGIVNHFSNALCPTYFEKNGLYFEQGILKNAAAPGVLAEKFNSAGKYDLMNDSISFFPNSDFPHFYKDKLLPIYLSIPSRILDGKNQWVYSWNALDSILIYDMGFKEKKAVFSKSKYRKGEITSVANVDIESDLEATISKTHYCKILYDPYRKKYLRFVQIGRAFDPEKDHSINGVFKNDFSIMVYDEDWNLISESLFKGGIYNFYHAFIAGKGLYLPRTNPNFKGLDEDSVRIEIYQYL